MNSIRLSILLLALLSVCSGCRFSAQKDQTVEAVAFTPEEQAAVSKCLTEFLDAIDGEGGTWNHLASSLKSSTSELAWTGVLATMKATTGKVTRRENFRVACANGLPDAPPGRYFIIDIDSQCERMNISERVVYASEEQTWKVAGYFRSKAIQFGSNEEKP